MCVSSMIGDHYYEKWQGWPVVTPPVYPMPMIPAIPPDRVIGPPHSPTFPHVGPIPDFSQPDPVFDQARAQPTENQPITREDFEELKKEVLEMKALLKKAIQYDIINNEPECENEQKYEFIRRVAALVDVDLNDILPPKKK